MSPAAARADLAAYDALPPSLRAVLRALPANRSAESVLQALAEDMSEEQLLTVLAERSAEPAPQPDPCRHPRFGRRGYRP